jgi:hypothetical protein
MEQWEIVVNTEEMRKRERERALSSNNDKCYRRTKSDVRAFCLGHYVCETSLQGLTTTNKNLVINTQCTQGTILDSK